MWMNVSRIHVRTVQSAPIHMETIIARAAVLSLERTVMWVRKLLIFRLHSSLGLFYSSRMNTWGSMVLPQEGCNSIHNNLPYSLCFVTYLEWSGRIHWFLSCTGVVLFIILEVCPWQESFKSYCVELMCIIYLLHSRFDYGAHRAFSNTFECYSYLWTQAFLNAQQNQCCCVASMNHRCISQPARSLTQGCNLFVSLLFLFLIYFQTWMSAKCAIRVKMEPLVWTQLVVTAVSALKTTKENTVMKVKYL